MLTAHARKVIRLKGKEVNRCTSISLHSNWHLDGVPGHATPRGRATSALNTQKQRESGQRRRILSDPKKQKYECISCAKVFDTLEEFVAHLNETGHDRFRVTSE